MNHIADDSTPPKWRVLSHIQLDYPIAGSWVFMTDWLIGPGLKERVHLKFEISEVLFGPFDFSAHKRHSIISGHGMHQIIDPE